MGLGHYGHAEAILLAGQDKRRATLAKKKREKTCAEATPADIHEKAGWQWTLHVCPGCGKANFNAPRKCLHRHPEDNELFEIDTVEVTVEAVAP